MKQDKPPAKPKLSSSEQRIRRDDRIAAIRLRMAIGQELDIRGITTPTGLLIRLGQFWSIPEATQILGHEAR